MACVLVSLFSCMTLIASTEYYLSFLSSVGPNFVDGGGGGGSSYGGGCDPGTYVNFAGIQLPICQE